MCGPLPPWLRLLGHLGTWCSAGLTTSLIFRQTAGTYLSKEQWRHTGSPTDPNFSILDRLEAFRGADGKFLLKIVWPDRPSPNYNMWKQSSNPVKATAGGVTGYEAVDIHFTAYYWGGLEYNTQAYSLLDGSVDTSTWYYAVGSTLDFSSGIPASGDVATQVELYVLHPGPMVGFGEGMWGLWEMVQRWNPRSLACALTLHPNPSDRCPTGAQPLTR